MNLFDQNENEEIFRNLFFAPNETAVNSVFDKFSHIFNSNENWFPLGGSENNYGVVKNQQASPIGALVEKLTNSIDAILMRKCYEAKIDPKSLKAPKSISKAVETFFPNYKNWDLAQSQRKQAENIQIVADGKPRDTSVIIYDNGEGQNPEDFEATLLSLLKGNKNEIHFVQGKYNMGGSGAIVFCGKKRYQLIASKRFDGKGEFGFTIVREHPLTEEEQQTKKNTWYEYLKIDDKIPSFQIDKLDLKLHNRKFETGTILKLYSYQFPSGYSGFSQELNQSLNEFLFEPALPILTVDNEERYPNNKVLRNSLFGLKRRLELDTQDYLECPPFSETVNKKDIFGEAKITCYVFKAKNKNRNAKESKKVIRDRYFKNNMSVLFSLNGQVHGHFTTEFISRSLKLNLIKNHVLINVDCSKMNYEFRNELFMASRDRLKDGDEAKELRKFLTKKLGGKDSGLVAIEKRRRDSMDVEGSDTKGLLKSFTKTLPLNSDLLKLLDQTFKLDEKKDSGKNREKVKPPKPPEVPFNPQLFPTFLKLKTKKDGEIKIAKIPFGNSKTLRFETDVEDKYFDRIENPGELKIALVKFHQNESQGGNKKGESFDISDFLDVEVSSPKDGIIKVSLEPQKDVNVGDVIELKATLTGVVEDFDEKFLVKISEPQNVNPNPSEPPKVEEEKLGLPEFVLVFKELSEDEEGSTTWEKLEESGVTMDYGTVIYPSVLGENLEKIFINMDSHVFKNYKSKFRNINAEQLEVAKRKYITSVYFHTLFLYTITKNRKYKLVQENENGEDDIDLSDYLKDLFSNSYSEFILNFGGMNEMMEGLGD